MEQITEILKGYDGSSEGLNEELFQALYGELRRLAGSYMARERANHTLQPMALVNEAYLRMINQHQVSWKNRSHFMGIAAQLMRRILVDHARARKAEKRGGSAMAVTFDDAMDTPHQSSFADLLDLDRALRELLQLDERQGKLVEMRYFGGLTLEEIAKTLGVSLATVKRDWAVARAWLHKELTTHDGT